MIHWWCFWNKNSVWTAPQLNMAEAIGIQNFNCGAVQSEFPFQNLQTGMTFASATKLFFVGYRWTDKTTDIRIKNLCEVKREWRTLKFCPQNDWYQKIAWRLHMSFWFIVLWIIPIICWWKFRTRIFQLNCATIEVSNFDSLWHIQWWHSSIEKF